ncbi:MAG: three-Cys-motif partner protein TcmP [Vicinamibacterales bacterium]
MDGDAYIGREQTLVKHRVLRTYLSRFAPIVLSRWDSITYVDCFSGPWKAQTEDLSDTSFAIAVEELRKARAVQREGGRAVEVRCFFLEKDASAHEQLKGFAARASDVTIETRNAALEDSVPAIVSFVRRGGTETFPFIFIDPTGWTGFAMDTIAPLLALRPCEVLVNLMTKDVRRFLEAPAQQTQASFERLFGRPGVGQRVVGTQGLDRDDVVVEEYSRSVKDKGNFTYVCTAIVLNPEQDRTHFHLIYATRHRKGVEVFKDAEKKAMKDQEAVRAAAEARRRLDATGMASLFGEEMHSPAYYDELRGHYLNRSRGLVRHLLEIEGRVPYEQVWDTAMAQPLTWESDLKDWLRQWASEGRVSHEGWTLRQQVPHLDASNVVVWSS